MPIAGSVTVNRYVYVSPLPTGSWVIGDTPSCPFGTSMPCQWMSVLTGNSLVICTSTLSPTSRSMRGPGTMPLYAQACTISPGATSQSMTDAVSSKCLVPSGRISGHEWLVALAGGLGRERHDRLHHRGVRRRTLLGGHRLVAGMSAGRGAGVTGADDERRPHPGPGVTGNGAQELVRARCELAQVERRRTAGSSDPVERSVFVTCRSWAIVPPLCTVSVPALSICALDSVIANSLNSAVID